MKESQQHINPRNSQREKVSIHAQCPKYDSPGSVVEDTEHWKDAVGGAVCAPDVGSSRADVVDGEANASSALGNDCTLLEGVVNALNAVVLHADQEAARQLGVGSARVEQRWGGVREHAFGHQVVRLDGSRDIVLVDADRHAHEHVLGTLDDLAVNAEQVGALQGLHVQRGWVEVRRKKRMADLINKYTQNRPHLESKVIVVKVPVIADLIIQQISVLHNARQVSNGTC